MPRAATIPIVSTTTAAPIDGLSMDAEHWYRNLREPVRFEQAIRSLAGDGVTAFIECSPHPALTWAVQETVDDAVADPDQVAVAGSLRRDEGTLARFMTSAAEVHAHGVHVDWEVMFAGSRPRRVRLPSYPFARTRFWLESSTRAGRGTDLSAAGVDAAEHPLLGAAVSLAGQDAWLWTGRISAAEPAWLADHEVLGDTLVPGSALLEIALHAGARVACDTVQELTLEVPLVLRGQAGVRLQASVGEPDGAGRRAIELFAGADAGDWVRHAAGTLSPSAPAAHAAIGQLAAAGRRADRRRHDVRRARRPRLRLRAGVRERAGGLAAGLGAVRGGRARRAAGRRGAALRRPSGAAGRRVSSRGRARGRATAPCGCAFGWRACASRAAGRARCACGSRPRATTSCASPQPISRAGPCCRSTGC